MPTSSYWPLQLSASILISLGVIHVACAEPNVVGIGIAKSNDHVYAWFDDGKVTSGSSDDFENYAHAYEYTLPPGKKPHDILAMSIAKTDRVYTWWRDGTVTSGTSSDLDAYTAPTSYTLPPGKTADDVVGIAIAGSNDYVYTWYSNKTVSVG